MTQRTPVPLVHRHALLGHCPGAALLAEADARIAADPAAQAFLAAPGAVVASDLQTRVTDGKLRIKSVLWTVQVPCRAAPGLVSRSLSVTPDCALWFEPQTDPALALSALLAAEGTLLLRHVPGRRATLRCRHAGGEVIRKFKKPDRLAAAITRHRAAEAALAGGPVRLPRLQAGDGTYMLDLCPGRPLADQAAAPDQLATLGAMVAHLHCGDAAGLPAAEMPGAALPDDALPWLAAAIPGLAARWSAFAAALQDKDAAAPALCHGDLSVAQVLADPQDAAQLTLLDFDRAGAGCPARDLGTLLATLPEMDRPAAEAALLDGYAQVAALPAGLAAARAGAELDQLRHLIRKGTAPTRRIMDGLARAEAALAA